LLNKEKSAFLKFFITYFISVAILILAAGLFYFEQMKNNLMKIEEFSLIEYARHIKMHNSLDEFGSDYHHLFIQKKNQHINISNFTVFKNEFTKYLPMNKESDYLQVFKSKNSFSKNLFELKSKIILIQILLLILFAYISYRLAKSALKPLQDSIITLDKFAKDLIHDLNTPVTAIKLNMKILQKSEDIKNINAFSRLNKSVHTISELHENLTVLLQEETFQMQVMNISEVVNDVIQVHKVLYPNLEFIQNTQNLKVKINPHAMKQILQNIISNACKYNSKDGFVKIYEKDAKLYIQDNGKGIKEPTKIFDRSYSGEHSSGIGLDIVKRLSESMKIDIDVKSNESGSCFVLKFH